MPSKDQRRGGLSIPGQVHHITLTTAGRRPLFEDFSHARLVIAEMRRLQEQNIVHSLAWVLMPDHLHWLLQLRGPIGLANAIKVFKGRSARIVVTMGMPGLFYRLVYRAHSVKSLQRNILAFCGVAPVRTTVIGTIESRRGRTRALAAMAALGRRAA